ncbi:MAG: argininosuccinate lyase [Actinobacteria bacterium]|nr:argininosuccinate lyase [Actinomycetota bacterium]
MAGTEAGGPLWSGRLEGGLHPDVLALTQSLDIDQRLLPYDVAASQAHVRMLGRQGIIPAAEAAQIEDALGQVTIDDGATDEDVHSLIERQLVAMLGDTGRRVHAGRSRNDQVATAFRLWCRAHAYRLQLAVADLQQALLGVAERDGTTVLPAFTHLQRAQPVPLAHHVAAHAWALQRDVGRFVAAQDAANVSPLGAGALAGSSLPLDPAGVADDLGMRTSFVNSLDAVSDRDFAADLLYACALCLVHCSRMGEELILWTSQEFGWAALADDVATGSSMMPQKKNPDVAELARGRSGTAIGRLTGLLATMKGLPLTYNRDLQEDKEGVFAQVDATIGVLRLLQLAYEGLTIDAAKMRAAAADGTTVATDVAEALVRGGMPFRDAHTEVATRIAAGERFDSPTPEEAIAARQGPGMPGRVNEQLTELTALIATTRAASAPTP